MGRRKLTAVPRTSHRRIRKRSIIRTSGSGDQRVPLSTREQSIGNCPSLGREVVHGPLVGLNRTGHAIENVVDPD